MVTPFGPVRLANVFFSGKNNFRIFVFLKVFLNLKGPAWNCSDVTVYEIIAVLLCLLLVALFSEINFVGKSCSCVDVVSNRSMRTFEEVLFTLLVALCFVQVYGIFVLTLNNNAWSLRNFKCIFSILKS